MHMNIQNMRSKWSLSIRWTAIAVIATAMTGCATQRGLYQWGGYDSALYTSYKNPEAVVALQTNLEKHIAAMQSAKQKVAPGLHAELGSLYLQSGDSNRALDQYRQERQAWPESRGLMDAMIRTLESRAEKQSDESTAPASLPVDKEPV